MGGGGHVADACCHGEGWVEDLDVEVRSQAGRAKMGWDEAGMAVARQEEKQACPSLQLPGDTL